MSVRVAVLLVLAGISASIVTYNNQDTYTFGFFGDAKNNSGDNNNSYKDSLSFVGDVMLARHVEYIQNTYGLDYVFAQMPPVSSSTYLVGNFEAAVPKQHTRTPDMTMSFSVPTSSLPSLSDAGFSYMSLANNHSYDKGVQNFYHTQKQLTEAGIHVFGDQTLSSTTVTHVSLQDRDISLIGLYAVQGAPDEVVLKELLAVEEEAGNTVVVYIHWGTEYEKTHSAFQENFAHTLVQYGADVIIGHHPHVVQDIEQYNGAIIFYSLGNFVFDQYFNADVQEGLYLTMTPLQDTIRFDLHPVTSVGSRSQPRSMSSYEKDLFLKDLQKRSRLRDGQTLVEGYLLH